MGMFDKFNLRDNPFRMVPASEPDKLIWAGFPAIKKKFERRIQRSLAIPNSTLVLDMGEYGSGKTHAARYFSKESILRELSSSAHTLKMPLSICIDFPSSSNVVFDIYTQIIDHLDFKNICESIQDKDKANRIIDGLTSNEFIKDVLKAIIRSNDEQTDNDKPTDKDVRSFLYMSSTARQRETLNMPRGLSASTDIEPLLGALFTFLTSEVGPYSCIILWIDEFEDINTLNTVGVKNTNGFIRSLFDKTPERLLMFINFTMSALSTKEDLFMYLQDAVKSRINDHIDFDLPGLDEFKEYLHDLLNSPIYRNNPSETPYFPFNEDVIDRLYHDVSNVSLRRFNEALSLLLESAVFDGEDVIDLDYYNRNRSEIIGWKDE